MHKFILILLAGVIFPVVSVAQRNLQKTDSVTYRMYLDKKWTQLLRESQKAFREGTDFYYLRIRAGVAAYESRKYRQAVKHFQRAFDENSTDDFLNSYYYWSLIMSGREDEAQNAADRFSPSFLKQEKIRKKGLVYGISSETLFSFNPDANDMAGEDIKAEGSYSNYRSVLRSQFYQGFSADHHLLPRLNLYQNLSFMGIDRTQQYQSEVNLLDTLKESVTNQFQYFLSGRMIWGKGWTVSAAFTRLWGKSYFHIPEYQSGGFFNLAERSWGIRDYLVNAGIAREMTFFRPELDCGWGKINRTRQLQANLRMTIYPLQNVDLYMIPQVSAHWDGILDRPEMVFIPKVGIKAGPVWLAGEYGIGRIRNFFSEQGLVVFNMPETITGKWGISLWAPLFQHKANLMLQCRQSKKEGMTFVYSDAENYTLKPFRFNDRSLFISLKWNL